MLSESAVAGLVVVVPILVTLLVLNVAVGYVVGVLELLVDWLARFGVSPQASTAIVYALVVAALSVVVVTVGFLTRFRYGERAIDYVDYVVELVPGIGSVYRSFREMGDVMLESEAENFREVKLVEFPNEGTYTMGFLTTDTPGPLQDAAREEGLVTLFLPLAPNPVMGGHLVHVPAERVRDVDMTVEEGIRTVVTSGVATASPDRSGGGLSRSDLRRMSVAAGAPNDPRASVEDHRGRADVDRRREYEQYLRPDDPRAADSPRDVERRQRDGRIGRDDPHPEDVERGDGTIGRDDAHPRDVANDQTESLGDDADTPEDVENRE